MILDKKNKSLEVKLAGAITTNQLVIVGSYSDKYQFGESAFDLLTNGVAAVKVIGGPQQDGPTARVLNDLSIQNTDTAPATVTVQLNNNATIRQIYKVTLQPNDTLFYDINRGWYVMDSNGGLKDSLSTISVNFSVNEIPTGVINGSNITFNLANSPTVNSEMIYYNGQLQRPITDYTIAGATITFITAPDSGTSIYVSYRY